MPDLRKIISVINTLSDFKCSGSKMGTVWPNEQFV